MIKKKIALLHNKYQLSQSEDEKTPDTALTSFSIKEQIQSDDSDTGTPNKITLTPLKMSKFKIQHEKSKSLFAHNARNLVIRRDKLVDHPFRQLIFGQRTTQEILFKHIEQTQRGVVYATQSLKPPSEKFLQQKKVDVPLKDKEKKILILDLDETLIHSCKSKEKSQVQLRTEDGQLLRFNIRPYLAYFLDNLSTFYQIFIFTASSPGYALALVDYIDPLEDKILGIFTRNHCLETKNGYFIKDLRILRDVDLKNIIIVDNLTHSFGFQLENGIPILEWTDDEKDQELKYLVDYLIEASQYEDVRDYNRQKLKLYELIDYIL
ncbi:unnamed protein product [Paramecium pentaurelia]|uniref:Mitochondrial import inner membrane translocase subunit TIM50 n=1 Tax=Paramecium pentaurelia TaxID=43138 RepID=A0A8S1X7M9_9CILI|nr:unnamed protein product [Paramecium pentaurelia]